MNITEITRDTKMHEWTDYWFDTFALRTIKQSTAVSYKGYIRNHINPKLGDIRLCELNADILQHFFNEEYDSGNRLNGDGLSAKTLRNIKVMVHKCLKKAYELDLIDKNHAEFVELPVIEVREMCVMSRDEQRTLSTALKYSDEDLRFGVRLSLATGMRLGEILGLKWGDIDFSGRILHIRRTVNRLPRLDGNGTEIVIGTPKSKSSVRDIPFSDCLKKEFEEQLRQQRMLLHAGEYSDYVLMRHKGHPVEPKTMQEAFSRIIEDNRLNPNLTFHSLRHTFATRAIEKNVDVKTLSVLLGHADVSTTLNRYAHVLDKHKREVMERLLEED